MGYTHYFKQIKRMPVESKKVAMANIQKIVADAYDADLIQREYDDIQKPVANSRIVRFNGIGDDGHETFYLSPNTTKEIDVFNFCKTARKPYDVVVTACLIALMLETTSEYWNISSDGDMFFEDEWQNGLSYYLDVVDGFDSNSDIVHKIHENGFPS